MMKNTYSKKSNSLRSWGSIVINQLKGINHQRMMSSRVLQRCPNLFPNLLLRYIHSFKKCLSTRYSVTEIRSPCGISITRIALIPRNFILKAFLIRPNSAFQIKPNTFATWSSWTYLKCVSQLVWISIPMLFLWGWGKLWLAFF